jgi:hypothetical protein
MDYLISGIQRFAINKNEDEFNYLLNGLNGIKLNETDESEDEWEILKDNYSKLKYIHDLINFYHIPEQENFTEILKKFIVSMEEPVSKYLLEIDWFHVVDELKEDCEEIERLFECFMGTTNIFNKLKFITDAYNLLIPIVEDFRNEKIVVKVDKTFRDSFKPLKKQKR